MSTVSILPGSVPVDYLALVHVDNVTIVGDGANIPLSTVAGAGVVVDGVTIAGAGTEVSPLHTTTTQAPSSSQTFIAIASENFLPGQVISIVGNAGQGEYVRSGFGGNTLPLALSLGAGATGNAAIGVTQGPLTLTVPEWDAIIQGGSSTGLTPGATYFLDDAGSNLGFLTSIAPTPGGLNFNIVVGYAISTTEMYVKIFAIPVQT